MQPIITKPLQKLFAFSPSPERELSHNRPVFLPSRSSRAIPGLSKPTEQALIFQRQMPILKSNHHTPKGGST
jgi:hypothetical protein